MHFAVLWVPLTVLVVLPVQRLLAGDEPLDEAVLNAGMSAMWMGPALYFGHRLTGEQVRRRDPQGEALRQAVRHGTVPHDDTTRSELPGYLARQRWESLLALAFVLPACVALGLFGVLVAGTALWAGAYSLVGAVSVAVVALTLFRVRRLKRRLAQWPSSERTG